MFIYNISFVADRPNEQAVVEHIRKVFLPVVERPMQLLKVKDVPGAPDYAEQATTLSLQVSFDYYDECSAFGEGRLPQLLERFTDRFANTVQTFATILESCDL